MYVDNRCFCFRFADNEYPVVRWLLAAVEGGFLVRSEVFLGVKKGGRERKRMVAECTNECQCILLLIVS